MNDFDEMITCPCCCAEVAYEEALLGVIGTMIHYRCRNCGSKWNEQIPNDDKA